MCLADFCDIFRCEVFENPRKDFFWEKKLCKEDRLTARRRRCEVTDYGLTLCEQQTVLSKVSPIDLHVCHLVKCTKT